MTKLSPLQHALNANMLIMESHLCTMLENIQIARHYVTDDHNLNAAIGTLLQDAEGYQHLGALFDATLALHRQADIVERYQHEEG